MRFPTTGKLAVLATSLSFLVSGVALAQGTTSATPATPATPAAPAAAKDHPTKSKAKANHKRSHQATHKARTHRKEKAAS